MLRAPFHRTWRKIYENALVCFCPKIPRTSVHCLTPFPTSTPPPPPRAKRPVDKWICRRENVYSLQLHNSWGILHISRYIWFETDSALNNDLINSEIKILSLWKLPGNVTSTSCESVMPATIPAVPPQLLRELIFFLRLLTRMNPGILLCYPYFLKK